MPKEPQVVEKKNPATINKTVKIESLIDAYLQYTGQETGQQYEWARAGTIISVREEDAPELLAKRLGKKTCCGNGDNKIFQVA